jgi:hypothetical protein
MDVFVQGQVCNPPESLLEGFGRESIRFLRNFGGSES